MQSSNLSFEEYAAWCASRVPPISSGAPPESYTNTIPAESDESCPVTVRSTRYDCVVVTPRPKGSY